MRKVLAISGGVDSVSMLHMMHNDPDVIVTHFNHGIRPNSDVDEAFVKQLAESYHLTFVSKKENLGPNCSEAHARNRRYEFLNQVCQEHQGEIYTAHHQDDLVETIAINILRGTGWRGLVPLDNPKIHRPLINMTKKDIYQYATKSNLIFRHDATNTEDNYLRNRIRHALINFDSKQLIKLYENQKTLKTEVDQILQNVLPKNHIYERSWFVYLDDNIATEILRTGLAAVNRSATQPQLKDFLAAIRTYQTNKKFNLGNNYLVTITKTQFKLD
ncbi:tRNA lysidine(34) synthetase TilS [Candidatus Saccharibacteria bacterium]|nr:tRNA lysidine(34) synthetase TilS [Candidatus Saccharibacteria bacterium]